MTKPHGKPPLITRTETRANPSANNQAQMKGIRAKDKRLKAQILAVPPEERSPFDQSCRRGIEDREEAELINHLPSIEAGGGRNDPL